uniref:Uncharacterized protein n=1 Tax=Arundo donax TaxID=35708 RepID=A0A0A9DV15_ARUDO
MLQENMVIVFMLKHIYLFFVAKSALFLI